MGNKENFESLMGEPAVIDESNPLNLQRAGVIGAGTMGQGIAQMMAANGIDVILVEKDDNSLERSLQELDDHMDREIERWGMTASEKRAILARITGTTDYDQLENVKLIIEAVPEIFDLKESLFAAMDHITEGNAYMVSNTSTLSLSEIAASTSHPDKVIGMHFMNPVTRTKLVEVVRGLKTSEETYNYVKGFAGRINKVAVEVFEYPGYITTRIIMSQMNEAMFILMEGVASAQDIDTAVRLGFNYERGPLEFADLMGLDEVMQSLETLFRELGDLKYRPCPLLRKMVRAGHLGMKTGQGFFRYDKNGKRLVNDNDKR
jgi:3-hydroxybutyryl-CoA dehydrogenase